MGVTNRGYKVFDSDWTCRGFQYEVGKEYKHEGGIELCGSGFHFCKELVDCFNYYAFNPSNKVAVIEYGSDTVHGEDKSVTASITIVKELTWEEVLRLVNTGKDNSGNRNSGDGNSGNRNSGYWNSGDWNSGHFNTNMPDMIRVFNKECPRDEWDAAHKPDFLYFDLAYVDDEDNLITLEYEEAFKKSWDEADKEDRIKVKDLPNFDADIFFEISGIDLREDK